MTRPPHEHRPPLQNELRSGLHSSTSTIGRRLPTNQQLKMRATCIAVLCTILMAITSVEGFGLSAQRPSARTNKVASSTSSHATRTAGRRTSETLMFFDFGKKKEEVSNARPVAGGTVKGGKKTKITQEVSPAQSRAQEKAAAIRARGRAAKKTEGVFTPPQFEAFKKARKEIPSGKGDAYWKKIAARVPGQDAAACKRVAESLLFEAAVGSKSNYFGGYIETIETPDYVDPEADIMFKINKFFGRGEKEETE